MTIIVLAIMAGPIRIALAIPVTDGLIGYWPADGNGSDLSGFGRDLTLNGGLGFSNGLVGQAFNFHQNNAEFAARMVDDSAFDFGTSDFTLQVWASFNNFGSSEHTLFEKFTGSGGPGWTLTQRWGPSLEFYANGAMPDVDSGIGVPLAGLTTNAWHHILVRRSGNTFTMFFDGSAIKSVSGFNPNIDSIQPLRIGNRRGGQEGPHFSMDGRIDEAAIWNRALTDAEVTTIFRATVPEPSALTLTAFAIAAFIGRTRQRNGMNVQECNSPATTHRLEWKWIKYCPNEY